MTLNTTVIIVEPVPVREVLDKINELMLVHDPSIVERDDYGAQIGRYGAQLPSQK
jgi:hypothetical protein